MLLRGKYSSWRDILAGVPQGSILGPVIYLIFSEDIKIILNASYGPSQMTPCCPQQPATRDQPLENFNLTLNNSTYGPASGKLKLNQLKTVSRGAVVRYFLIIDGVLEKEMDHQRHLGVTLSSDGRWTKHLILSVHLLPNASM